ncbi:MAG: BadF/BadG/BcrA/BcrD ATPase family protein [Actinomycetota bacterium]
MTRPAILAVDGGGSKMDAVLVRRDGTLLGAARIPTGDFGESGGDTHMGQVIDVVVAVCADAEVSLERFPVAELGVYCLAGADLAVDDRRIVGWLRSRRVTTQDIVRNDTFAVLRAGTDRTWGVGVVCGYGTNCSGVAPDGRITRFPSVGPISGDWGGGAEVGGAGLWFAIRAEDGRGDTTSLARLVPAHFGLRRPKQVLEALYLGRIDEALVAELAPVVFGAATEGDPIARSIIDRQADEIVLLASTAIRRLRMARLDVDVVLGGGLFRNDDVAFFDRIDEGIHATAPAARTHVLTAPPVLGAALLGLDRLGAGPAAHRRLRGALTHDRLAAQTHRRR